MVQAAIPMQALVKQGGLHGGGDLGSEPEKLRRRSAGGGQSRGFPVWEPWKRIAFWSPGDRSQWLQPRRRKEGGEVEGLIIKGALSLPPTEPQPHQSQRIGEGVSAWPVDVLPSPFADHMPRAEIHVAHSPVAARGHPMHYASRRRCSHIRSQR